MPALRNKYYQCILYEGKYRRVESIKDVKNYKSEQGLDFGWHLALTPADGTITVYPILSIIK